MDLNLYDTFLPFSGCAEKALLFQTSGGIASKLPSLPSQIILRSFVKQSLS